MPHDYKDTNRLREDAVPTLSIVVPCFNEASSLPEFHRRMTSALLPLGDNWEIIYVNDGSEDESVKVILGLHATDPRVALVDLSRNFGKEAATTAGLDNSRGAAVVVIDADLQDPPELIPQMVFFWQQGFDMVYAQRRTRDGETFLKTLSANLFYKLMQNLGHVKIPPNTGDFRLLSRRAVEAVLQLREHHRFMKGIFAWVGFPSHAILYDRAPRYIGKTKWSYWKLWNFALDGITSFTVVPLKLATYIGLTIGFLTVIYISEIIIKTALVGNSVAGYPSLLAVVLFLGGTQLVTLGLIGEYLGRIFNESKQRPLYFVQNKMEAKTVAPAGDGAQGHGSADAPPTARL